MARFPFWRILGSLALFIFVIVLVGVGIILFVPSHVIQQIAGSKGSTALGRDFAIDGPVTIDWDWTTPFIHINKIRIGNMPGSKEPNMIAIDEVNFHIKMWKLLEGQLNLPDIVLNKPHIVLEELDADHKNWEFPGLSKANAVSHAALPTRRSNFPILGLLTIHDGLLIYHDATKNLSVQLNIDTANAGGGEKAAFTISGNGDLQNKPFEIKAQGGSLAMLRNSHAVYPLNLHIAMGATKIDVDGTFTDPVQMEGIDTTLDLSGANLADLFYLTEIPLPPTPTYKLSGHLTKKGDLWTFEKFQGKVGGSDLEGDLSYDTSGQRGYMKAVLTSQLLDMKNLAGFVGGKSSVKETPQTKAAEAKKDDTQKRVLPDVSLDLTRLRATDMDVDFKAAQVLQPGLPMNDMDVGFHLKDGVLRLDPFDFGVANGKISGSLVLDGRTDTPRVQTDLSLQRLSLKQFFTDTRFAPLAEGFIGGHFKVDGQGHSLAEVLASSNGHITLLMSGGSISRLIVDAAGLDLGHATPLLLDQDKPTGIRCMVGDFDVKDGMLNSDAFVFDTTASNINGEAHVNLRDESINAKIESHPKRASVAALTPIVVGGHLAGPSIGLDPKEEGARVGAAAVLSAFLTPLAGIIPFIELGLGKDSDCKGLIEAAREHQAATPAASSPKN